jgi:hypothetical protein
VQPAHARSIRPRGCPKTASSTARKAWRSARLRPAAPWRTSPSHSSYSPSTLRSCRRSFASKPARASRTSRAPSSGKPSAPWVASGAKPDATGGPQASTHSTPLSTPRSQDRRAVRGAALLLVAMRFFFCLPRKLPLPGAATADFGLIASLGVLRIGVAYRLLSRGIKHLPSLETALLRLGESVLARLLAWRILDEPARPWAWAGCGVSLAKTPPSTSESVDSPLPSANPRQFRPGPARPALEFAARHSIRSARGPSRKQTRRPQSCTSG